MAYVEFLIKMLPKSTLQRIRVNIEHTYWREKPFVLAIYECFKLAIGELVTTLAK